MSKYNIELQSNNNDLQSILNAVKAMPEAEEQATPEITVNSRTGLITATAGSKSSTYQMAFQEATTITPEAVDQIAVLPEVFVGGEIAVKGDANLIPENIKQGTQIFGVVGNYAGAGGDDAQKVFEKLCGRTMGSIANSQVTIIGSYTFAGCAVLQSADFPACTTLAGFAFSGCQQLTNINIPACTNIGTNAFYDNYNLKNIDLPACTYIGSRAFARCFKLSSINCPICSFVYEYAFDRCSALTAVGFPACTTVSSGVFYQCTSLVYANLPICTYVGNSAFHSCYNLVECYLPKCTRIGAYAFEDCSKLANIDLPSCTRLDSRAFIRCSSLTSISVPLCSYVGETCFYGNMALQAIDLPNCTTISGGAFRSCSALINVNLPACTRVDNNAFEQCKSLTNIDLPRCLTIGSSAFISCYALSKVTLSACIKIWRYAFYSCSALTNLTLYASSVAGLDTVNALYGTPMSISTLTGSFGSIYVPAYLVDAYKSATNWATYADRITAIPDDISRINFTIEGTSYQAENGMTWEEWVDSDYAPVKCKIDLGKVVIGMDAIAISDGIPVAPSDTIIADYAYKLIIGI